MKKKAKKATVLSAVIKEYLNRHEPIGSNELSSRLDINISASTIRLYLKEFCDEGILRQEHISGGRVPTVEAMKEYWLDRLDLDKKLIIDDFEKFKAFLERSKLYSIVKFESNNLLKEVINVSDRYLLLVFDENEIVIEYHKKIKKLLNEFIGYSIDELKDITKAIGLVALSNKLREYIIKERLFVEGLINLLEVVKQNNVNAGRFLKPSIIDEIENGIYFDGLIPKGYMVIKRDATIEDENAKMLYLGQLYYDYESFFESIGG